MFVSRPSNLVIACTAVLGISLVLYTRWRQKVEMKKRKRRKKQGSVNIGSIFGMDVGGTLTKIVYFEANIGKRSNDPQKDPKSSTKEVPQPVLPKRTASLTHLNEPDHQEALEELYNIMDSTSKQRLNIPTRDESLSFYSTILGGRLHFLHFETRNMVLAINMLSSSGATENIRTIGCTGGGAHKYANQFEEQLGITFHPFDELGSLIRGMNFALTNVDEECYTYRREETQSQTQSQSDNGSNQASSPSTSSKDTPPPAVRKVGSFTAASLADKSAAGGSMSADSTPQRPSPAKKGFQQSAEIPTSPRAMEESKGSPRARDAKDYCHRVTMPHEMFSTRDYFPYLVVNIGSGVSIVKVSSPGNFERVSGTSLGGGTYWGLCRLLTGCSSYEEVLDKAEGGNANAVDMLVSDIYGGGYDNMKLSGSMVASSFGKLVMKDNPKEGVREEDLAIALLMMITNNIGQVAYLNAQLHGCTKIFFVGSFLRHNLIACRRLSYAIDFWSQGKSEALFLTHEGYLGALGTFLCSAFGDDIDKLFALNNDREGNALPLVKKPRKHGAHDPDTESNNGEASGTGTGMYGLDVEFLRFIRSWRPTAFGMGGDTSPPMSAAASSPSLNGLMGGASSHGGGHHRSPSSVHGDISAMSSERSTNSTSAPRMFPGHIATASERYPLNARSSNASLHGLSHSGSGGSIHGSSSNGGIHLYAGGGGGYNQSSKGDELLQERDSLPVTKPRSLSEDALMQHVSSPPASDSNSANPYTLPPRVGTLGIPVERSSSSDPYDLSPRTAVSMMKASQQGSSGSPKAVIKSIPPSAIESLNSGELLGDSDSDDQVAGISPLSSSDSSSGKFQFQARIAQKSSYVDTSSPSRDAAATTSASASASANAGAGNIAVDAKSSGKVQQSGEPRLSGQAATLASIVSRKQSNQ